MKEKDKLTVAIIILVLFIAGYFYLLLSPKSVNGSPSPEPKTIILSIGKSSESFGYDLIYGGTTHPDYRWGTLIVLLGPGTFQSVAYELTVYEGQTVTVGYHSIAKIKSISKDKMALVLWESS